jgi:hypothetical protein
VDAHQGDYVESVRKLTVGTAEPAQSALGNVISGETVVLGAPVRWAVSLCFFFITASCPGDLDPIFTSTPPPLPPLMFSLPCPWLATC